MIRRELLYPLELTFPIKVHPHGIGMCSQQRFRAVMSSIDVQQRLPHVSNTRCRAQQPAGSRPPSSQRCERPHGSMTSGNSCSNRRGLLAAGFGHAGCSDLVRTPLGDEYVCPSTVVRCYEEEPSATNPSVGVTLGDQRVCPSVAVGVMGKGGRVPTGEGVCVCVRLRWRLILQGMPAVPDHRGRPMMGGTQNARCVLCLRPAMRSPTMHQCAKLPQTPLTPINQPKLGFATCSCSASTHHDSTTDCLTQVCVCVQHQTCPSLPLALKPVTVSAGEGLDPHVPLSLLDQSAPSHSLHQHPPHVPDVCGFEHALKAVC